MTQQVPIFTMTRVAAAAVAAQRFVEFDGTQVDVAGAKAMGVSETAASVGDAFQVNVHGTAKVTAGAAIPLGAKGLTPVKSDANGKAIPQAGSGEIAGYALQAASGDGSTIEVLLAL